MTPPRLRVGMGDSYGLRPVVAKNDDFDPAAVTGVVFEITKPTAVGGVTERVEWPGTIGAQSADSVEAIFIFDSDGSSLDFPGEWRLWLQWTVPGETPGPRTEVAPFQVYAADHVVR